MYDTSVNKNNRANQVSSRTPSVRAGINLVGFLFGDCQMKQIPLMQGKFALVSDEDYEWLSQFKWHAHKHRNTFYAKRSFSQNGKIKSSYMHREILNALPNEQTDHRNHNGLHNWRDNLRACTNSENQYNQRPQENCSSAFKGVHWDKYKYKWRSHIRKNGKRYFLGYFVSETEAAKAYDTKAKELFGEFAYLNF